MRDPLLRASASQWWDDQRVNGACVREDGNVQRLSEKLGYGYERATEGKTEGKLRTNAVLAVNALKAGLSSVPFEAQ